MLLSIAVNSTLDLLKTNVKNAKITQGKYKEDLAYLHKIVHFFTQKQCGRK